MNISDVQKIDALNLELLAKSIVEGFISGMHKSPFHGFSVEFSEHKLYNTGESTRHVDWKLYAKTDKLYTKKYEEETNLRCHIIVDNSASMYYPDTSNKDFDNLNKIGFSAFAAAALIEIFKRQRDAVGLSVYSNEYDFYAPEKGNERHRKLLYNELAKVLRSTSSAATNTYSYLHNIANKIHRRSLIFLFTDMFQTDVDQQQLFDALRHLKFNKHELVVFHTYDGKKEFNFDFDNAPKKFVDVETGESINLFADNFADKYKELVQQYFKDIEEVCIQYQIDYVPVDIHEGFGKVLTNYLVSRRKFS
ncbi:MAG: DUF58 domain-containing protein [Flavobacteriaceae bacterium]|nr:DUF58 domain-containing protein [Flavobacteriaceae bacterium]